MFLYDDNGDEINGITEVVRILLSSYDNGDNDNGDNDNNYDSIMVDSDIDKHYEDDIDVIAKMIMF